MEKRERVGGGNKDIACLAKGLIYFSFLMGLFSLFCLLFIKSAEAGVFRDDFNNLDQNLWSIGGWIEGIRCEDGTLKLTTGGGEAKAISITSRKQFLYGIYEARLRISRLGRGTFHYLGFMSRDPWAKHTVWLMDCETDSFTLWSVKDGDISRAGIIKSLPINPGQWYTVKIVWTPEYTELFVDNLSCGKVTNPDSIPTLPLPVVFDLFSRGEEVTMEIDWVEVKGEVVEPEIAAEQIQAPPLPVKPRRALFPLPDTPPQITLDGNHAILENKYYRYDLQLNNGLLLAGITNKYIGTNLISGQSRFFLIQSDGKVSGSGNCRVKNCLVDKEGKAPVLKATLEDTVLPLELSLALKVDDSPELSCQMSIKNTGAKIETFGITFPFLEHIRIGERVDDDAIFFPISSGICGSADYDLRGVYGHALWMQIINIFDPSTGGGIYTFPKDDTGTPKVLVVRRCSLENKRPPEYNIIPYQGQDIGDVFDQKPGSGVAIRHLEFRLDPGQTICLPEVVVGLHEGDWHDPLRRYSNWVRTWYKKEFPVPRWYMDTYSYLSGHPFAGLHLLTSHPEFGGKEIGFWDPENKRYRYADLMGLAEENSLQEFALWWNYQTRRPHMSLEEVCKEYNGDVIDAVWMGDYQYPADRGGIQPLKEEIRRIHEKKGRLLLYTYPEAVSKRSKVFSEHGYDWASMDAPGKYATRYTTEATGVNYCVYHPDYRLHFSRMIAERVKELDADGFRQDVLSYMFPCFNPTHPHYQGTLQSALPARELNEFLKSTQTAMRRISPEKIATTEHAGSDYLTCLLYTSDAADE